MEKHTFAVLRENEKKTDFETHKARFAQAVITAFESGVHTKVEGRGYMYDVESIVSRCWTSQKPLIASTMI